MHVRLCVCVCVCVCVCGLSAVKRTLLTRSENPTKTLLFGFMVSLVSGICRSSGNTHTHTHTHTHAHTQMVAFGQSRAGVLGRDAH